MAVPGGGLVSDLDRPCQAIEHLMRDFPEGPAWLGERQHFQGRCSSSRRNVSSE